MTEKTQGSQFKHLFTPLNIGSMTVKNRIVNTAHGLHAAINHLPSERHLYYYKERAKGGVGLIVMHATYVHPSSSSFSGGDVWNIDDSIIPWYERLSSAVHEFGTKFMVELSHSGRQSGRNADYPLISASSAITKVRPTMIPRQADKELLAEIAEAFGKASRRCQQGSVDGVEIHGSHGNLIQQFFSHLTNQRTDEYGGSVENRMRFAIQILEQVRKYVGANYVVGMRISGSELVEGGLTSMDMQEIAWRLEQTGLLNYLSVSMGHYYDYLTYSHEMPDMSYRPGAFVHLAGAIKKVVKLPIFCIGRINHPMVAEQILASGQADMVGMVRALIADPHLPNKAKEGRLDDIRYCVGTLEGCRGDVRVPAKPIGCIQNPITGREKEWSELPPARTRKRVVVVGGGPAGMELARVATLRGHKVILFEKGKRLGGQVIIAAKAPGREEYGGITEYLSHQIEKHGVDIRLGVEATAESVLKEKPDVVAVATGATLDGLERPWGNAVSTWDVLEGKVEAGKNVVVFDEMGDQQAFGAAELLAKNGHKVEVVTQLPYAGINVNALSWRIQYQRMLEMGVVFTPLTWVKEVDGKRVTLVHDFTGARQVREGIDTVVVCSTPRTNDSLYYDLKGKVSEVHLIGDAAAPRGVQQAIYDGHKIARLI